MDISKIADYISVLAGLMTIIGVGGIVSWSFILRSRPQDFPDGTISIFVMAVKLVLCILAIPFTGLIPAMLHVQIVLAIGPPSIPVSQTFWNPEYPAAYITGLSIGIALWLPFYLLSCASLFTWSLEPFRIFIRRFRNES